MNKRVVLPMALASLVVVGLGAQMMGQLSDDEIRERVAKSRADLRSLHTGVETYRVDYNQYPSNLKGLTTPISYLSSFIPDQFENPLSEGESIPKHLTPGDAFLGMPGYLKMGVIEDDSLPSGGKFIGYSVGPDGDDDRGEIEFDPTNGLRSNGDIVRVFSEEDFPNWVLDDSISSEYQFYRKSIQRVREGVINWAMVEKDLPPSIQSLTTPIAYLDSVPKDPFLSGLPLGYVVNGEGEEKSVSIYSVGPDLDDDQGVKRAHLLRAENAAEIDGDLIERITWSEIKRRMYPNSDESGYEGGIHPWKSALIDWQEKNEGRENAFLWYHEASTLAPGVPSQEQQDILDEIRKGERFEDEVRLRPWLNLWEESFDFIHRGAALDFAEGPGGAMGYETPVPNFLTVQMAAKALVAEAVLEIEKDNTEKTVKNLETALIMARDYQSKGSFKISYLISFAATNMAMNGVEYAIQSDKLDSKQLGELVKLLAKVDSSRGSESQAYEMEKDAAVVTFKKDLSTPEILGDLNKMLAENNKPLLKELPDFESLKQKVESGFNEIISMVNLPVYERTYVFSDPPSDALDYERIMLNALFEDADRIAMFSKRYTNVTARLRVAMLGAAVKLYEMETGEIPTNLSDLSGLVGGSVPIDPYSGNQFGYSVEDDGSFRIWSIGPDGNDGNGLNEIDWDTGGFDMGDIVFSSK